MSERDSQMLSVIIGVTAFYYWQHSIAGTVAFASLLILIYAGNGKEKSD